MRNFYFYFFHFFFCRYFELFLDDRSRVRTIRDKFNESLTDILDSIDFDLDDTRKVDNIDIYKLVIRAVDSCW